MKPHDITGRVLSQPLHSRYGAPAGGGVPRWVWLLVGGWLLYVGVFSEHSFYRIARLRREIQQANAEIRRVEHESEQLNEQVNDPEARRFRAEEIARTQHGWAAPGEIVYRFREGALDTARAR